MKLKGELIFVHLYYSVSNHILFDASLNIDGKFDKCICITKLK